MAALVDLAVLTENPLLDYPLALLGPITVVMLLAMIYTIVWLMLAKRENSIVDIQRIILGILGRSYYRHAANCHHGFNSFHVDRYLERFFLVIFLPEK